ncbi:hypothetical protein LNKW23_10690 [Paralimibaculum aggregatum]|uniref:VWFA domain-containing protein n=1 Tax=Paralimibaculum aggregatum TaxID=3036245 RepID=A0ABQ6LEU6_9RHOB|nr:hypothetical protein [Limibaculum sp. NKW23]GMG81856.1 hypothetical protein LNKW23_10690 [Limibaculum sp. NKW23]
MRFTHLLILLGLAAMPGLLPGAAGAAVHGSCAAYDFDGEDAVGSIDASGFIIRRVQVPVIRANAQILQEPRPGAAPIGALRFAQRVALHRREGPYIEIKNDQREASTIGWVHGDDLLCQAKPLVSNTTGLEQKFYIKTRATLQGDQVQPVRAMPSVEQTSCDPADEGCSDLTRFSLYYVHAVDPATERLLLLGKYLADETAPVIGWVDLKDGYLWETRFGLRPRPDLVTAEGQESYICVHETPEDARIGGRDCTLPVLGGERWFSYPIRIPVIERIEGSPAVYNVILPVAGVGQGVSADIFTQELGLEKALGKLQQLRKLDVFFLIDGTQSMEPHIDAIVGRNGVGPGILGAITEAFATDPRFSGTQVRFGYRVYRDLYDGQGGIGEGLPLSSTCDLDEQAQAAEHDRFRQGVRSITTTVPQAQRVGRDPDHEENMFFGLYQAVDDMSTCDEHVKLLFVIGDTGYSGESQIAQGGTAITTDDVVDFLTLNMDDTIDPIIPFFVQVPEARRSGDYATAYATFVPQAEDITGRVVDHLLSRLDSDRGLTAEQLLFSMQGRSIREAQDELIDRILGIASVFGDQTPINEIIAELKGGEALVNIITQLQGQGGYEEFGNLPGLRLAQIEGRLCEELGPACRERVFNEIATGYLVDDADVVTDVWMTYDEFSQWRTMLEVFRDTSNASADELSRLILQQMLRAVQGGIGTELSPDVVNQPIASFLERRHGLPVGRLTPLLNYTFADIMGLRDSDEALQAQGQISVCELNLLGNWLERHREIFDSVSSGNIPEFEELQQVVCPNARHQTPIIRLEGYRQFSKPGMDFKHVLGGRTIFWVPSNYIP